MSHKITEELQGLAHPIGDFREDPDNARHHNVKSIEAISASLNEFGQRMPIVVRADTMTVTAGNGRLRAARALGWTHIAAVIVDEDRKSATAYALADNKTAEVSEWNDANLAEALSFLKSEDESLLSVTAFDDDAINKLLSMSDEVDLSLEEDVDTPPSDAPKDSAAESIRFRGHKITLSSSDAQSLDDALNEHEKAYGGLDGCVTLIIDALG